MTRVYAIVVLLLCVPHGECAAQPTLHEYMELFAGEEVQQKPTPTIHAAAQEYIVGRQLLVQNKYGLAISHFKKSTELDDKAVAPWVGIARALSALGRPTSAVTVWREVLARNP